jgi:Ca2+/Na+ antiporter
MPKIEEPFNLVFLGRFDLAHTSFALNLIQSLAIFVLETLSIYTSPYPPQKGEVVRLQLVLPLVSFFIFMFLPAGKKLFVITTLLISIILVLYKYIRRRFEAYKLDQEAKEQAALNGERPEEQVVVEVK